MELVAMGAFVDPQRPPGLGAAVPGDLLRLLGGLVGVLTQAHLDEAKVVARQWRFAQKTNCYNLKLWKPVISKAGQHDL